MNINNQGARPNYQSSILPLSYLRNKGSSHATPRDLEREARHERWIGGAYLDLAEITERQSSIHILSSSYVIIELDPTVDFEQPRALYANVMNDTDRAHLVSNIVDHVRGVKSPEIKTKIREFFLSIVAL